ncbi:MAG: hypothetical protein GYA55_00220, partial [SAR324 cluster bacterium]|nr:hypothetical protein [SAR324 cluster bacterium]
SGNAVSGNDSEELVPGADAFLVEPFSVEAVQKIYNLAVEVRSQRIAARQKSKIQVLIREAIQDIDSFGRNEIKGLEDASLLKLEKLKRDIKDVADGHESLYFDVLEEIFLQIKRPRIPSAIEEPSSRFKKFSQIRQDLGAKMRWRTIRKNSKC